MLKTKSNKKSLFCCVLLPLTWTNNIICHETNVSSLDNFGHMVTFELWFEFSLLIFFIGVTWLLLNWKNFLITMLCIELMYFGIVTSFILASIALEDPTGQIYALLLVILAAAESAIGLGILIVLYRFGKSIDFVDYQELKG